MLLEECPDDPGAGREGPGHWIERALEVPPPRGPTRDVGERTELDPVVRRRGEGVDRGRQGDDEGRVGVVGEERRRRDERWRQIDRRRDRAPDERELVVARPELVGYSFCQW